MTIHGRTRAQMYTGEADWTLIGEVKNNPRMTIPIIGNGDITSPERARECFDATGWMPSWWGVPLSAAHGFSRKSWMS